MFLGKAHILGEGKGEEIQRQQHAPTGDLAEPVIHQTDRPNLQAGFFQNFPDQPHARVLVRLEPASGRSPDQRRLGAFEQQKSALLVDIPGHRHGMGGRDLESGRVVG